MSRAFSQWKIQTEISKKEESVLFAKNKKLTAVNDEIEKFKKKLEHLNKRKEELDSDLKDLKKRKKEQQEYLKDLEQEKQSLECEHLEKQLKVIEDENMDLRMKLDSTQDNVGSFISEMSTLLDSHDLQKFLETTEIGMRFEYDNFGSGTDEFEETHQQHAGTGGSSKIKSRPAVRRGNHGHGVYHNR